MILLYKPARADVGVEGGDGEDAEAVQRLLRRLRHLRQDALKWKACMVVRFDRDK